MFSSNCCFLTCIQVLQEASQVVWYSYLFKNFPQFVVIHTVKGFGIVSEAHVFLEFHCFFCHSADVGNLFSGSSAFSKSILDICKFLVCIMLKLSMQDFKHDLTSTGDECNCPWLAHSLVLPFMEIGMRIDLFQSCDHYWVFQICWHIECNTLMTSSFRVLNSSTGIPLHPLALLTVVLPKAHLTWQWGMFGSRCLTTPSY